jgi:hypothetical protein
MESEQLTIHSSHQTQLETNPLSSPPTPLPPPPKRKWGSYTVMQLLIGAWRFYSYKIGCHYFWPWLIALHKNTLSIELKIKTQRCELTQTSVVVKSVTCGALLTRISNTGMIFPSVLASLARKAFGFSPLSSLGWAYPPVVDFWDLLNKPCLSVILFSLQRTLPELLHLMWPLLPVKPTASGFTEQVFVILARFPPLS